MEIDSLKEQLGCIKNEMTHLWGSAFLLAGGAFSLMFYNRSFEGYLWGGIGVIIALILGHAYVIRRVETLRIVNKIKEIKK